MAETIYRGWDVGVNIDDSACRYIDKWNDKKTRRKELAETTQIELSNCDSWSNPFFLDPKVRLHLSNNLCFGFVFVVGIQSLWFVGEEDRKEEGSQDKLRTFFHLSNLVKSLAEIFSV